MLEVNETEYWSLLGNGCSNRAKGRNEYAKFKTRDSCIKEEYIK
jgi:hypothetical protein